MGTKMKMGFNPMMGILFGICVLISSTGAATTAAAPAPEEKDFFAKVSEFYSDKNNMAMYLVLPIIILVYGGCSLVYCCAKFRRYLKAKKQKKNKAKRNFEQAEEPINNNNEEGGGFQKTESVDDEDDMKKRLINSNSNSPEPFGRENTGASLPNQIDDDDDRHTNNVNDPAKQRPWDDNKRSNGSHYNNLNADPTVAAAAAMAYEDKQRNISPQNYDNNYPSKDNDKDLNKRDIPLGQYPKSQENSFEGNDSYPDRSPRENRSNSRPGSSNLDRSQPTNHPWDAPEKVKNQNRHPSPDRLDEPPAYKDLSHNDNRDPRSDNRGQTPRGDVNYRNNDRHTPDNYNRDTRSQNRARNDDNYRNHDPDGQDRGGYPPPSRHSRHDDNRGYNEPQRQPNEYRGSPIDTFRSQTPRGGNSSRYNDHPRNPSRYSDSPPVYRDVDRRDPENQWATKQYPPRTPPPQRERKKYDWSFDGRRSQMEGNKPHGPERGDGSVSVISYKDELMDKYEALSTYVMAQRAAKILRGNENEPPPQSRMAQPKRARKKKLIFVAE